jgi:hypothetical protein
MSSIPPSFFISRIIRVKNESESGFALTCMTFLRLNKMKRLFSFVRNANKTFFVEWK